MEAEKQEKVPQEEVTAPQQPIEPWPYPSGAYDPDDWYDVRLQALNLWPKDARR